MSLNNLNDPVQGSITLLRTTLQHVKELLLLNALGSKQGNVTDGSIVAKSHVNLIGLFLWKNWHGGSRKRKEVEARQQVISVKGKV